MRNKLYIPVVLILILVFGGCPKSKPQQEAQSSTSFRKDGTLQIKGLDGNLKASFDIEIAEKEKELMQGLKYRENMEDNQGMLFIFNNVDYHSFWMQDTYLSLDMIFIDHHNQIISIAKNTSPYNEEPIFPEKPNQYVLEVMAGTCDRLNIEIADEVTWQKN
ncbi:MAG: DUF192 domain-containing protein [Candidatus Cloacimonetes bacterium]|nr:DUF192 domain-containing protein [Candidatus Cloacimonadota bacterium]